MWQYVLSGVVEEAFHTMKHRIENCLMHGGDKFASVFAFDFQVNLFVTLINNKSPKSIMVKLLFSILFYFSIYKKKNSLENHIVYHFSNIDAPSQTLLGRREVIHIQM